MHTLDWMQGELSAIDTDMFYIEGLDDSYTFNRDSAGNVESFTSRSLFFGDEWLTAKRILIN